MKINAFYWKRMLIFVYNKQLKIMIKIDDNGNYVMSVSKLSDYDQLLSDWMREVEESKLDEIQSRLDDDSSLKLDEVEEFNEWKRLKLVDARNKKLKQIGI